MRDRVKSISSCIEDFDVGELLGKGGFGSVYRAKCNTIGYRNKDVAIKKISKEIIKSKEIDDRVFQEKSIHGRLRHKNIVDFYTTFDDRDFIYLVMEWCSRGSLENYLKENGPNGLPEVEACHIIKQVSEGLMYLHKQFVLHRDLSLRNILLTEDMTVKIIDFGFAAKLTRRGEKKCSMLGTPNFMSPEVLLRDPHGFKTDCWSLGCVLFSLLSGKPPFHDQDHRDVLRGVIMREVKFPNRFSKEAKELLTDLLNKDQYKRAGLNDLFKYGFFEKYRSNFKPKNDSYGNKDSGMGSVTKSSDVTSRKYSQRSYKTDSGLGSINSGSKELKMSRENSSDTARLKTIHSSEWPCQSDDNRSRGKYDLINRERKTHDARMYDEENYSTSSKECSMRSRSTRTQNGLPSENYLSLPATEPEFITYSNRRERSVSKERQREEFQNAPRLYKEAYSREQDNAAHQNLERSTRTQNRLLSENYPSLPATEPEFNTYSNRRARSVSKERQRQEFQNAPRLYKETYSREQDNAAHQKDYYKMSQRNNRSATQLCLPQKENDIDEKSCDSDHGRYMVQTDKCDDQSCRFRNPLFEKQYAKPEAQYHDPTFSNKPSSHNGAIDSRHKKHSQQKKMLNGGNNKTLKEKISPLNALRIAPIKKTICQNGNTYVIQIFEDGHVCVELLKTKNQQQYVSNVCLISINGKMIILYKPEPGYLVGNKPPPEPLNEKDIVRCTFDNFPVKAPYMRMYRFAKTLIDVTRAKTPKIIIYGKIARCIMMENTPDPDFEMHFYDGFKILKRGGEVSITDVLGNRTTITEVKNLSEHFKSMWEEFISMKKVCEEREEELEPKISDPNAVVFPAVFGNSRHLLLSNLNNGSKDNISLQTPRLTTFHQSKSNCKPCEKKPSDYNSSQKYRTKPPLSYQCEESLSPHPPAALRETEKIFSDLKSKPQVIKGKVYAEYKGGYHIWSSLCKKDVSICDSRYYPIYNSKIEQRPDSEVSELVNKILKILPDIILTALKSDGKVT